MKTDAQYGLDAFLSNTSVADGKHFYSLLLLLKDKLLLARLLLLSLYLFFCVLFFSYLIVFHSSHLACFLLLRMNYCRSVDFLVYVYMDGDGDRK